MSERLLTVLLESLNRLLILAGVTHVITQTAQQINAVTLRRTQMSVEANLFASLETYYLREATIEW